MTQALNSVVVETPTGLRAEAMVPANHEEDLVSYALIYDELSSSDISVV